MTEVFDAIGPEGFGTYEVDLAGPTFARVGRPPKGLLVPGFIDIHIHGAFGIDFMSASAEDMQVLCGKLGSCGYEGFLPTTITAPAGDIAAALRQIPNAEMVKDAFREEKPVPSGRESDAARILGFHLEGPFISPEFPGAQPPSHIAAPPAGPSAWDTILDDPRLRVVTMAPEVPNALELITRFMKRGVIVSMGHTNATFEEARRGFEFGASHTTHTFNAMRGLHHREAGTVGYALTNDAVSCELIYDRLHVSPEAAKLLFKCKPIDRVIAVSDSTLATGLPPGQAVKMWGLDCIIGRGQVRLASNGALAGSAITLLDAFRNLHDDFGPEVAIRACSLNPRRALEMTRVGKWLVLDRELKIVRQMPA